MKQKLRVFRMFKIINLVYIISYQSDFKINFALSIYLFIQQPTGTMSKALKPQQPPLKFDTSSANIGCFIRGKSKHKSIQNDRYTSSVAKRKRRDKTERQKQIQFQDNAFLESVVCKILNDADCKGITQLIDNMVFPISNPSEKQKDKDNHYEQFEQEQISHIFSNFQLFNNNHHQHHIQHSPTNKQFYRVIPPIFTNYTIRNSQQKYECATTIQSSLINSPRSEINPQVTTIFAPTATLGCGYNYYTQGSYIYPRQLTQRKKKSNQGEQISQYKIVPQKIEADGRTTLMIRHIPNKYSEEMLFQEIGKNHKMKINFLYLPIDHYNSCNVGYAFVNFIHTKFICDFYKQFNRRRWDRFNSEKICELAYARIQGTTNLMDHFHGSQSRVRALSKTQEMKSKSLQLDQSTIEDISKFVDFPKVQDS